jgi:polysaccharide export outer membrane protein
MSALTLAYALQTSDAIQINVFNEPDLSVTVRLNADGTIMFPLVGRVALSGLTVQQAQDLIAKKLGADYLVNPQVTLTVIDYTKKYFTVLGQVAKPGSYEIPEDGKITLLQAIGMAGGFTRIADPAHLVIKRVTGDKQNKIIKVNVKKLAREDSAEGYPIQAGDTVTVPESWF